MDYMESLMGCKECGTFFDVSIVEKKVNRYGSTYFVCPVCKGENHSNIS